MDEIEKSYVIGLDLGGTNSVFGIVDARGDIKATTAIKTKGYPNFDDYVDASVKALLPIIDTVGGIDKIKAMGIGAPNGNYYKGTIENAANLEWEGIVPIGKKFEEALGIPVVVTNDANAAALGEARYGAGKEYKNSILVTLGTGVGGGIIIDGKLFEGGHSVGTEIGHMVIERHGEMCTCGRRGCFERYSSATALTARTRYAMEEDAGSAMWSKYTSQTCTGKTAFEFKDVDRSAKEVVDWYVKYLACGLVNLANIFRPEVIMLGGGVSAQGECLTKPVQEIVNKELFGGCDYAPVTVITASLGNRAGAMGAAAFAMDEIKMGE